MILLVARAERYDIGFCLVWMGLRVYVILFVCLSVLFCAVGVCKSVCASCCAIPILSARIWLQNIFRYVFRASFALISFIVCDLTVGSLTRPSSCRLLRVFLGEGSPMRTSPSSRKSVELNSDSRGNAPLPAPSPGILAGEVYERTDSRQFPAARQS